MHLEIATPVCGLVRNDREGKTTTFQTGFNKKATENWYAISRKLLTFISSIATILYIGMAKILIVEDDQFLRELYADVLKAEGYIVDSAVDGEEGLKRIKDGGYDLILLDIIMPKIDGLEIMKRIKSDPPINPNKCTVFLTNLDKDEEIKMALKLGEGYLIKSQITPGNLIQEVKIYLEKFAKA
ncbi:MAG: response regulator [Patescibacteria group bacterium]